MYWLLLLVPLLIWGSFSAGYYGAKWACEGPPKIVKHFLKMIIYAMMAPVCLVLWIKWVVLLVDWVK